jgi:MFS family permease
VSRAAPEHVAQPAALSRGGLRRVLTVLCVTEITSWGVLYYALPIAAPSIAADTGWPLSRVVAAFSAGLVVAALLGIPAGRWLDRFGPRWVMTAGSVLAAPAVLVVAAAPSLLVFVAGWVLAGVAMAGVLYQPAFAALTGWWGPRRVTALTVLTLLAGLASTIFAPITAVLLDATGWRTTFIVLAVVLAVVTVPLHLFGLHGPWPRPEPADEGHDDPAAIARSRPFVLLVAAVGLSSFVAFAVVVNQVPLLIERGLSTTEAAWALGLGGAGQVLGRLGYARLAAMTSARVRTVLVLLASAVLTALLGLVPGPPVLLIVLAVLVGAARGVFTLVQATAVTDRWGAIHYGRLGGILAAPAMIATAVAPWAGAAAAEVVGGYPPVFALLAALGAVAALLALGAAGPRGAGTR